MRYIKSIAMVILTGFALLQLGGCATVTASGECAAELYKPTIGSALDSFESAAIAIKLSNRVLLKSPLSEQDTWPSILYGAPSGSAMVKGAFSLIGTLAGVSVPLEIDPETGFPRPTSALYIFLKDRSKMLDEKICKEDLAYFKENPNEYFHALGDRKKPDAYDENSYRNPLMAFGVVNGNQDEMLKLEQQIQLQADGFGTCDAWSRNSKEGDVKETYCKDPALKDEALKASLVQGKIEDFESKKKAYTPLANAVYKTAVAGADFSVAASTKIVCAIAVAIRAIPNMKKEFSGWKGVVNIAMLPSRIKNVVSAFGIYRDNLGLQITAYKTMYNQIKDRGYEIKDTDPQEEQKTKAALLRIEQAEAVLCAMNDKLDRLAKGESIEFGSHDMEQMAALERLYNTGATPEDNRQLAMQLQ